MGAAVTKLLLLLRIVSAELCRYGLTLMRLLVLAETVMMLGTTAAELEAAGAEVTLAVAIESELEAGLTWNTNVIV